MKFKKDFVTNSSSVSFILSDFRNKEKIEERYLPITVTTVYNMADLIIKTYTTLSDFENDYPYVKTEEPKLWKKCKDVFKKNGVLHFARASDHSSSEVERDIVLYNGKNIIEKQLPDKVEILIVEGRD